MVCETKNIFNFKGNSSESIKGVHSFHVVSDVTKNCSVNIDKLCKSENVFSSS